MAKVLCVDHTRERGGGGGRGEEGRGKREREFGFERERERGLCTKAVYNVVISVVVVVRCPHPRC